MAEKNNILDAEAEKLFQELGGIDRTRRKTAYANGLADDLESNENEINRLRMLLLELTQLLGLFLKDIRFLNNKKTDKDPFIRFSKILSRLSERIDVAENIFIRLRDKPSVHDIPRKIDYVIWFGNMKVDIETAHNMAKRMGSSATSLIQGVLNTFEVFSDHTVNNFYLKIPEESSNEYDLIRISLWILSQYKTALKTESFIVFEKDGRKMSISPISDERDQPDPNLTLVAGLNNLKQKTIQDLVSKVDAWMKSPNPPVSQDQFVNVYNALFGIDKLRKQLIRPPIEINNIQYLMLDVGYNGTGYEKTPLIKNKMQVARIAMEMANGSAHKEAQIIESIYGDDFGEIDSSHLENRLGLVSDFLDSMEANPENPAIENEVLENLDMRLEVVKDDVFENLFVPTKIARVPSGEEKTITRLMQDKFYKMVTFFKGRAVVRKKMKAMISQDIDFDHQDYEIIGKDFDISYSDAMELIQLLKECFDGRGHFVKNGFERNIPKFSKHEKKIFEFLWHYLKETPQRTDRVAFLNSLQLLIARMKQPVKAIQTLINDFLSHPEKINFSDRNAMILANILVRKYNKELMHDIEITPEEVLLVIEGLDRDTAYAASKMIDDHQETFFEKIKMIHTRLKQTLDAEDPDSQPVTLRFLLALEREIYIFLSLIDGSTSRSVILSALNEYGTPGSEIYSLGKSHKYMVGLLQLLKVIIRARSRLKAVEDVTLLDQVIQKEKDFMQLGKGMQHKDIVRRIMKWAKESRNNIVWKNMSETEKRRLWDKI